MVLMRWLPWLLLAGCQPASDGVILRNEPLESLPGAWLLWRTEPETSLSPGLRDGMGLVIFVDGHVEAVSRTSFVGQRTVRGQGSLSPAARAEIVKAMEGPIAAPVRPKSDGHGGLKPETEGGGRYVVQVRNPDGSVHRLEYEHRRWWEGESGGEPLHPLFLGILQGLSQ